MRRHLLILSLLIGTCLIASAQDFDVTKSIADTKAFTFDDGKNSVRGYIATELEVKTKCCGKDRIYLEIKIDPSGYVLHAKSITGTNECIKRSAEAIVKNIKWDAAEFRGPTSKYLEIRPDLECKDERDNSFTQIEVFNNELLDAEGNPLREGATNPVAVNNDPPTTKPTPPEVKEEKPAPTPVAKEDPPAKQSEPKTEKPMEDPVAVSSGDENAGDMEKDSPDAAIEEDTTDPTRAAQEEEVIKLREQLADMRRQEIEKRRKQAARERARKRKEQARQEALAAKDGFADQGADLFANDPYAEDTGGDGFGESGAEGLGEDARLEDEIARLKEQIGELAAANEERDAQVKASIEEAQQTNQEILRINEQIVAKEEEKERYKEEQELEQLDQEKAEAEDARRQEEEAYARMMEEIKRLQEEADAKIAELEEKKKEVDRMATLKTMREQEIALNRAIREKEAQARLTEVRMSLQASGNQVAMIGDDSPSSSPDTELMAMLPELANETGIDSERLAVLIRNIELMTMEIQSLRRKIAEMEAGGAVSYDPGNRSRGNDPTAKKDKSQLTAVRKDGFKDASKDRSWEDLDYKQKDIDQSIYTSTVKNDPPQTNPGKQDGGQSGAPIQQSGEDRKTGNHENSSGPKFVAREYVGGKAGMKDLIKSRLKDGGICGLAQSVFAVTLNQSGSVIKSDILAANNAAVKLQLANIVKDLKFNEVETRIPQTIYLEFKAEILCEGEEKVNLQEVEDIIKK